MSEPLKISILDRTDTEEFIQLIELLKEFTIETYIKNKPEYATLKGKNQMEAVSKAILEFDRRIDLSILTQQDIEQLKKDIDFQISMAKKLIDKKQTENTQTRYYIMKEGKKLVAFQQGQVAKEKERIEGWSNLAYTKPDYRYEGQVIDSKGILRKGKNSELLYDELKQWFDDNGVNYERTCTGVNMIGNIYAYIVYLGYLPFDKNDKNIFLEKNKEQKIDRKILSKVNRLYRKHRERTERKSKEEILEEIDSIIEFEALTDEQKSGLVQCFLREDEKEFEMPDDDKLKIIEGIPEGLTQLEIARYIYIQLGKYFSYDEQFIRFFHDQKSDEFFEDMQIGRYTITEQQIGKVTIDTPIEEKSDAKKQVIKDEQEKLNDNTKGE